MRFNGNTINTNLLSQIVQELFKLFMFIIIVLLCALRHELINGASHYAFVCLGCASSCVLDEA